jgi:hypothetical protein
MGFFKNMFKGQQEESSGQSEPKVDMREKNKEVADMLLPKIQGVLDRVNEGRKQKLICEGGENNGEYSFFIKHEGEMLQNSPLQLDINLDNIGQELHSHYVYRDDMYFSVGSIGSFLKQGIEDRLVQGK